MWKKYFKNVSFGWFIEIEVKQKMNCKIYAIQFFAKYDYVSLFYLFSWKKKKKLWDKTKNN